MTCEWWKERRSNGEGSRRAWEIVSVCRACEPRGVARRGWCEMNESDLESWARLRRGVEDPCGTCHGTGVRAYTSTSTWRGGMGGAKTTKDVCDRCWGSGDSVRLWPNLRRLEAEEDRRIAARAADLFSQRCGVWAPSLLPALEELATELDGFSRQRRPRPNGWDSVTRSLARALREMVAAKRQEGRTA